MRHFARIISFPRGFWKEQFLFALTVNVTSSAIGNLGGRAEQKQADEKHRDTVPGNFPWLSLLWSSDFVSVCHYACIFNMILVILCVHCFRYYFFALKSVTFTKALKILLRGVILMTA